MLVLELYVWHDIIWRNERRDKNGIKRMQWNNTKD